MKARRRQKQEARSWQDERATTAPGWGLFGAIPLIILALTALERPTRNPQAPLRSVLGSARVHPGMVEGRGPRFAGQAPPGGDVGQTSSPVTFMLRFQRFAPHPPTPIHTQGSAGKSGQSWKCVKMDLKMDIRFEFEVIARSWIYLRGIAAYNQSFLQTVASRPSPALCDIAGGAPSLTTPGHVRSAFPELQAGSADVRQLHFLALETLGTLAWTQRLRTVARSAADR